LVRLLVQVPAFYSERWQALKGFEQQLARLEEGE